MASLETDSTQTDIITIEVVKQVLDKDKGPDAEIVTWEMKNFTAKGDNYVCLVCCVKITYNLNGKEDECSYIAKLNPCLEVTMKNMFYEVFHKEGKFYFDMVPKLNDILSKLNIQHLKVPHTYILNMETGNECMFMEDLRQQGYKSHDRTVGFDVPHTILALKELAKLHAAAMILHLEDGSLSLIEKFPYLNNLIEDSPGMRHLFDFFHGYSYGMADVAKELTGYEGVSNYISTVMPGLYEKWVADINFDPKFITVCHGDVWCNNMMFSYDRYGSVKDIRLLDLQLCNIGSLMQDIALFFFSSVSGPDRRRHLDTFLDNYYASFIEVFAAGNKSMPFTRKELQDEYHRMLTYGITMSLITIPISMDSGDIPDFGNGEETSNENVDAQRLQVAQYFKTNKNFRSRYLDLFNDILMNDINNIYISD